MSIFSKWRKKRHAKYSAVYAGPEQMARRNRFEDVYGGPDMAEPKNEDGYPENRKDEDRPLETVYGGPRTDEDLAQEIPPEPVMAPVYGGPEMMGGNFEPEDPDTVLDEEPETEPKEEESASMKRSHKVVFGRVYAGPERMSRANPFEDVYAGPEPEDDPVEEETVEEPEPEEKAEEDPDLTPPEPPKPNQMDPRLFMAAYAGPQFYNNGPQYQLVYAGPQFFNPGIGAAAPMQPEPGGKKCPSCGSLSPLNAKFCPECGKPFPKNACPGCGSPLPENTPFCPECGMPCKKETEEET